MLQIVVLVDGELQRSSAASAQQRLVERPGEGVSTNPRSIASRS